MQGCDGYGGAEGGAGVEGVKTMAEHDEQASVGLTTKQAEILIDRITASEKEIAALRAAISELPASILANVQKNIGVMNSRFQKNYG